MNRNQVHHWMTPDPITTTLTTTLTDAHELMQKADIRHLPVVADGQLIAVISKKDIQRAQLIALAMYKESEMELFAPHLETVAEMLTGEPLITISLSATVNEAAKLMLENQRTALPIVSGGRLVGIITESDLFRVLTEYRPV